MATDGYSTDEYRKTDIRAIYICLGGVDSGVEERKDWFKFVKEMAEHEDWPKAYAVGPFEEEDPFLTVERPEPRHENEKNASLRRFERVMIANGFRAATHWGDGIGDHPRWEPIPPGRVPVPGSVHGLEESDVLRKWEAVDKEHEDYIKREVADDPRRG